MMDDILIKVLPGVEAADYPFMHNIQQSFGEGFAWALQVRMFLIGLGIALGAILLACQLVAMWQNRTRRSAGRPERVFGELLDRLALTGAQRQTLRAMARGARLRHPAMMLLSPGLLTWATDLWESECGTDVITPLRRGCLQAVAEKVFGQS